MTQYYASPSGGGTGLTETSPFKISNFLSKPPQPGDVLDLLDGLYQGAENMIRPRAGNNGTSLNRITIRAHNDGGVLLDGQFALEPVKLVDNSFWTLEGFNAKNGAGGVIQNRDGSNDNIFRRIVAWDMDIRLNAWIVHNINGLNVLFEDVAAFGTGVGAFGNGGSVIYRRTWGRAEGSTTNMSHKETYQLVYGGGSARCENCLSTATAISMPASFTVTDSNGNAAANNPNCSPGGTLTTMPCAGSLIRLRSGDGALPTGCTVLGSLAYLPASSTWPGSIGVRLPQFGWDVKDTVVRHVANFVSPESAHFGQWQGFDIGNSSTSASQNNSADRLTSLRGSGDLFNFNAVSPWTIGNVVAGSSFASIAAANPWTGSTGAQFCYRWEDDAVTTTPLWPWPMNERIKAATASAGAYTGPCAGCSGGRAVRTATDVTAEIEDLLRGTFGQIPSQCRSTAGSTPPPPVSGDAILPPPTTGTYAYYNTYGTFGPNQPGFLALGATYQDPVFGSFIRRLSSETGQNSNSEIYSKNGFYNATGAVMHHRRSDGTHALINTATGASVREGITFNSDSSFSPADPDIWYYFAPGTLELKQFSVATGAGSTLKTFDATLDQLGGSVDWIDRTGRFMALKIGGAIRVWDRETDTLYAGSINGSTFGNDWIGISPDANYVLTLTSGTSPQHQHHSFAINHSTKTVDTTGVLYWTLGGHADILSATDGKTYIVSPDSESTGDVYRVDVSLPQTAGDPAQQRSQNRMLCALDINNDSVHFSCGAKGTYQDWVFISVESGDDNFGDTIDGWRPYMQEIVMANVLTGSVRRLAHHRSRSTSLDYYYEPKVSASWDGTVVAWQSNYGFQSGHYADIYAISPGAAGTPSAPTVPSPTPTPPESTTIPSSDVRDYQVEVYVDDVLQRVEYVTVNQYVYTIAKNRADTPPNGSRTVRFDVRARMITGSLGTPTSITVTDPATGMN